MKNVIFVAIAALLGCTDGGESLALTGNGLLTGYPSCSPRVDDTELLAIGTLDTSVRSTYAMSPTVRNLVESADDEEDQIRNSAFFRRINVKVNVPEDVIPQAEQQNLAPYLKFSVPVAGKIAPNAGITQFYVEAVREEVGDALHQKLNDGDFASISVGVQVVAELKRSEQASNWIEFPIEVCRGCLTNLLSQSCQALPTDYPVVNPCRVGQDEVLSCCEDATNGQPVCPARSIATTSP